MAPPKGFLPWNKGKKDIYSHEVIDKMKKTRREINLIRTNPWGDKDRDGVINIHDCSPFNSKKQEVYRWNSIKHKVINKKYLYHKTELKNFKKILKTGELRPNNLSLHFHMSENYNPHIVGREFKQPVVLVLEKKHIPYLKKIDYSKPKKYKDKKFRSEKEWTTPGSCIKKVLKGVILNEKILPANPHAESLPTKYITEEDMKHIKFRQKIF